MDFLVLLCGALSSRVPYAHEIPGPYGGEE